MYPCFLSDSFLSLVDVGLVSVTEDVPVHERSEEAIAIEIALFKSRAS